MWQALGMMAAKKAMSGKGKSKEKPTYADDSPTPGDIQASLKGRVGHTALDGDGPAPSRAPISHTRLDEEE